MKHKKYTLLLLTLATMVILSCNDYLEIEPDNRVMIDTPEKVQQLLINSYPNVNYALVAELSADNFVDNNAPNSRGLYYDLNSYDRMDDDLFAWEDPLASDADSPYLIWEQYYQSIACANEALQAIDVLIEEGVSDDVLNDILIPSKGEALIIRAYSHFILVNIFAKTYKDPEKSRLDLGVPYITQPATEVGLIYVRNSVDDVYELIAKDIEAGISLIRNDVYQIPKYHFNSNAAHAFAAQFYLFKRDYNKTIEHANYVLGENPSKSLRDWITIYNNAEQQSYAYMNVKEVANLLVLPTYSIFFRRFMNYRYGNNGIALNGSLSDSGPTWNSRPPFTTGWLWTYKQDYGIFSAKVIEQFEYTDRVAGIGYPHIVRTEYTVDATLLDRAEAYIFTGQIDKAVDDLQAWNKSHRSDVILTNMNIRNFYVASRKSFSFDFNTEKLSSQFIVTAEQKPFVDCVLHFRRLERIFEGHRWFDIKRYGIELEHSIGHDGTVNKLTFDDDRRAIQIPSDVIGAGITPNPRSTVFDVSSQMTPYQIK